jgi:hypothetical protein
MAPAHGALVPAMGCVSCGRLVPRTDAPRVRLSRAEEKAVLRAARRAKMRRG